MRWDMGHPPNGVVTDTNDYDAFGNEINSTGPAMNALHLK